MAQKYVDATASRKVELAIGELGLLSVPPCVAHEWNNPLSVIAGRAQLLAQAESDGQRRHVLDVIGENAHEASGVVDDLMSYVQPAPPRTTRTAISQIIDESVQLAGQKAGAEHVNAQVHISPEVKDVLVDSAQVALAVANIIATRSNLTRTP